MFNCKIKYEIQTYSELTWYQHYLKTDKEDKPLCLFVYKCASVMFNF